MSAATNQPLARVPWAAVSTFVALAFGLAWLVALPLWSLVRIGPVFQAKFQLHATIMMFTPAIAALIVMFVFRMPRTNRMRFLGLWPLRPFSRVLGMSAAMLVIPALLVAASLVLASALGWVQLDLQNFSGFQQTIDAQLAALGKEPSDGLPIQTLALVQILAIPLIGLINVLTLATLGEELAWRGWLLPALRPLGVWPALIVSGAIWGAWHAPVILLGYNFNRTDVWGVVFMMGGCIMWGILFGWLRLRTGSLWPAVVAHGVFNAAGSVFIVTLLAGFQVPNMALINPLGVSGWIVCGVVIAILALTGQFKKEPALAPKRVKPAVPPRSRGIRSAPLR